MIQGPCAPAKHGSGRAPSASVLHLIDFGLCLPSSWKAMLYWGDTLGSKAGMDTYRHRQDIISHTPMLYWNGIPTHSLGLTEVLAITG